MIAEPLNRLTLTIWAFLSYISKVDGKQNSCSKGLTDPQKPFPIFFFWRKIDAIIIYDFVFMHHFWKRHKIANGKQVVFFSIDIPCRPLQSWMKNLFKGTDPQHKKLPVTFKGQFPFTEVARRKQRKGRILCAKTLALSAASQ